jgi:hypothetical protein
LRDLESRLLVASGILQSSLTVIQGIEACGRSLAASKSTYGPAGGVGGADPIDESELQFLDVLGIKCRGYSQSVDLIQRRVNVVIGLVRYTRTTYVNILTLHSSCLTGSTSKARKRRIKLQILVTH